MFAFAIMVSGCITVTETVSAKSSYQLTKYKSYNSLLHGLANGNFGAVGNGVDYTMQKMKS